ncbi:MAG: hypothetical protein AAGI49_09340 [Bacteroidota bacterium]
MRKYLSILCCAITLAASAQPMNQVEEYFTFFNNQHVLVNNLAMNYLQYSVHSSDFGLIEKKRQEVIDQLDKSITAVKAIEPLTEDDQLKPTALEVFQSFSASFNMDFVDLMQLKMSSQTSYESMEQYFEARKEAEQKMDEAANRYLEAQKAFAEKHNILLQDAEANGDIQDLNQLNNYHQAIFLKYFKALSRNNEFMNAMNSQDADAIAKARLQLEQDSDETLKVLQNMPAFKDDTAYRDAAIDLVEKLNTLAKGDFKKLEDISKKSPADRTQADVDVFNKTIQSLQTVVPNLNAAVNEKGNELMKKFVPKPRLTKSL